MDLNIDLGSKPPEPPSPVCCDTKDAKPYYPGAYLKLPPGTVIPPKGEICFKYRVVSARAEVRPRSFAEVCVEIELLTLVEAESPAEESTEIPGVEAALAAYAAQMKGE